MNIDRYAKVVLKKAMSNSHLILHTIVRWFSMVEKVSVVAPQRNMAYGPKKIGLVNYPKRMPNLPQRMVRNR